MGSRTASRRSLLDGAFLVAPIIEPTIDLRAWSIVTRGSYKMYRRARRGYAS